MSVNLHRTTQLTKYRTKFVKASRVLPALNLLGYCTCTLAGFVNVAFLMNDIYIETALGWVNEIIPAVTVHIISSYLFQYVWYIPNKSTEIINTSTP